MSAPAPLRSVLATLRKAGDEAQWTQVIGAGAVSDPRFASELVSALISECPRSAAVRTLGPVPAELECRTEVTLRSGTGRELGRVDLLFTDVERTFTVLAELKLHSAYRLDQLPDYLEALDALPGARKALLAVTKVDPLTGEELVRGDPRWLGSVRR